MKNIIDKIISWLENPIIRILVIIESAVMLFFSGPIILACGFLGIMSMESPSCSLGMGLLGLTLSLGPSVWFFSKFVVGTYLFMRFLKRTPWNWIFKFYRQMVIIDILLTIVAIGFLLVFAYYRY